MLNLTLNDLDLDLTLNTNPNPYPKLTFHSSILYFLFNDKLEKGKKCQWFRHKTKLLGQAISDEKIEMGKEKIWVLIEYPIPKCVKSLQEFLCLANFNRNKSVMSAGYATPL